MWFVMIRNQVEATALAKLVIEQNFGENSEAAAFIISNICSIFNNTQSTAAMLRAAYAISEIKYNPEEAKICSLCLANIAKNTKIATAVILAAEQLTQNKCNPNVKMLFSTIPRKAE